MADTTQKPVMTPLTSQRLQRVEDLLASLKEDAQKAADDGDTFMLGVYKELLNVASPIVVKAYARVERETKAAFNKHHKNLRKQEQLARTQAKQANAITPNTKASA